MRTKAVVQWIFINRTFLRLYDEGHSISASDYSSLQIARWSVDKGWTATSFHLSCFCCLNMLGTVSNSHLAHVLHTKSLLMCLMCQKYHENIMRQIVITMLGFWKYLWCLWHQTPVVCGQSLCLFESLRQEWICGHVSIRILLLCTETMHFTDDCKAYDFL